MLVLEGRTRTRAEVLADHAAQSKALLEPVAPVDGELVDGGSGSYRNTANRVAVTDGEFTQERRHLGVGEGGKPASATTRMCLPPMRGLNPATKSWLPSTASRKMGERGAPMWQTRPLMQVARCDSSAGISSGVSFHTGPIASSNSRSLCLNQSSWRRQATRFGAPDRNIPATLVCTSAGGRYVIASTQSVSKCRPSA